MHRDTPYVYRPGPCQDTYNRRHSLRGVGVGVGVGHRGKSLTVVSVEVLLSSDSLMKRTLVRLKP